MLAIVITGHGNQLSVQVDDGVCIEFKMQTTDHTVNVDGKTQTQSITEYEYWRPCGTSEWFKYEKGSSAIPYTNPSATTIFKAPKFKSL